MRRTLSVAVSIGVLLSFVPLVVSASAPGSGGVFEPVVTVSSSSGFAIESSGAIGPRGDAAVAWRVPGTAGQSSGSSVWVAVRAAGAATFDPPQELFHARIGMAGNAEPAALAVDGSGNVLIIWAEGGEDGRRPLRFALRPAGAGSLFGPSRILTHRGDHPAVVFDRNGGATAVWSALRQGDTRIRAAYRLPGAVSFTATQTISPRGRDASAPTVAVDGRGNAIAVWTARFGDTVPVGQAPRDSSASTLARPRPAILFSGRESADTRVQVAWRPAGSRTRFGVVRTLSLPGHAARDPRVAINARGDAIVGWSSTIDTRPPPPPCQRCEFFRLSSGITLPPPPGLPTLPGVFKIAEAVLRSAGTERFSPSHVVSSRGEAATNVDVGIDARGNATVAWLDRSSNLLGIRLRAAHRPQSSFTAPLTVAHGAASLALAVASDGEAILTWAHYQRSTHDYRVRASIRPPSGSAFGVHPTLGGGAYTQPRVALNARGDAVVAWTELRDGPSGRVRAAFHIR